MNTLGNAVNGALAAVVAGTLAVAASGQAIKPVTLGDWIWLTTSSTTGVSTSPGRTYNSRTGSLAIYDTTGETAIFYNSGSMASGTSDLGSYGDRTLQIANGAIHYMDNATRTRTNPNISVGSQYAAIGSAVRVGGVDYAPLISTTGQTAVVNLTTKVVTVLPLEVGSFADGTSLDSYLPVGIANPTVNDIRFIVGSKSSPDFRDYAQNGSYIHYDLTTDFLFYEFIGNELNTDLAIDSLRTDSQGRQTIYIVSNMPSPGGMRATGFIPVYNAARAEAFDFAPRFTLGGGTLNFSAGTQPGATYEIQHSVNLQTWTVRQRLTGDGLRLGFAERFDQPQEFLRAVRTNDPVVMDPRTAVVGPNIEHSFNTDPGKVYTIEHSTDLLNWRKRVLIVGDGNRQTYSEPFDQRQEYLRAVSP